MTNLTLQELKNETQIKINYHRKELNKEIKNLCEINKQIELNFKNIVERVYEERMKRALGGRND
jgi:hypothetical protein